MRKTIREACKALCVALVITAVVMAVIVLAPVRVDAQIPRPSQVARIFTCSLDGIAATLTLICPGQSDPTLTLYVTTIVAQSTTTTSGNFLLEYGTGTNCGTGTVAFFPSAAAAVRIAAPASTSAPTVIALTTPLKVPAGKDLCLLGVATNTVTAVIAGYVAPQ